LCIILFQIEFLLHTSMHYVIMELLSNTLPVIAGRGRDAASADDILSRGAHQAKGD